MSGYFSRIARQGGARIAADDTQRAVTPAAKTESHLAPIDQAETVMFPPRAPSDVDAARLRKPNVDAAVQDQTRGQKLAEQSTSAINLANENPPAEAKRPIEPVREELKLIEPETTENSHVPEFPSRTPQEKKFETLNPIANESAKKTSADSGTAKTPQAKPTEKKFFEKTVEIVEGQTTRPAEVHTILLREVQEWIAAGHTAPEDVSLDVANSAAEPLTDTSLLSEPEPGVVRIAEGRAKPAPQLVQEVSETNFSEQFFELSIGSISVVVEGDERTPAPAPTRVAAESAARETPPRMSRLSRHYL